MMEFVTQSLVLVFVVSTMFSVGLLLSVREIISALDDRRRVANCGTGCFTTIPECLRDTDGPVSFVRHQEDIKLSAFPLRVFTLAVSIVFLAGCGTLERRQAVPEQDVQRAEIPGIPNARYWPLSDNDALVAEALAGIEREQVTRRQDGATGPLPPAVYLSISGGGDKGAFGAGLLNGWTAHGDRPQFKVVTGISTGALIAPFAFLGSDYDNELAAVYTSVIPEGYFQPAQHAVGVDRRRARRYHAAVRAYRKLCG